MWIFSLGSRIMKRRTRTMSLKRLCKVRVKPRLWIALTLLLLITTCVIQLLAVLSSNWIEIQCQNGSIQIGLWEYCGEVLVLDTANSNQTVSYHPKQAMMDWLGFQDSPCLSFGLKFDLKTRDPAWFYANQILQILGLATAVLTTLLYLCYCCTPRPMVVDVTRGFAGLAITSGTFTAVGMLGLAGRGDEAYSLVPRQFNCMSSGASMGLCIILSILVVISLYLAACILVSVYMLEQSKKKDIVKFRDPMSNIDDIDGCSEDRSLSMVSESPVKPKRLRATCNQTPDIKAINHSQRLLFTHIGLIIPSELGKFTPSWKENETLDLNSIMIDYPNVFNNNNTNGSYASDGRYEKENPIFSTKL